ncbi:MAG: hypothetical protein RL681_203 [Candidatus Parcubacteria bacterium]|jgi:hypothetical protein
MNIYVLPTSEQGMQDRLFDQPLANAGGVCHLPFLDGLRAAARSFGHAVHTSDAWSKKNAKLDDVLVVQNHPGETILWRALYYAKHIRTKGGFMLERRRFLYDSYRLFNRRVLLQMESPMVMPYIYRHLHALQESGLYQKIMIVARGYGESFEYFNPYFYRDQDITSPYFTDPKDKFLVMVNGNARPHSLKHELYGERLKAIRYFSDSPGFDLYGRGWDAAPHHPFYMHYKKYVARAWRGAVDDKLEVISRYRFAMCYENATYNGYVSEKIFDCLAAGAIPIYLGAPDITTIVPENCFIDKRKFSSYAELHQHVRSLSETDCARYRENILRFLRDRSTMMGMQALVRQIVG